MATTTEQDLEFYEFDSFQVRDGNEELSLLWQTDAHEARRIDWRQRHGYCPACRGLQPLSYWEGADLENVNLREHLICTGCGMNSRLRAAYALYTGAPRARPDRKIYITEQVTPTFVWLQKHLDCKVIGSEFESDPEKRKVMTAYLQQLGGDGDVRFDDVTRLSFWWRRSLDAVLSFDVLEHVPDYRRALKEFARVLRPGGHLIATFPFLDQQRTVTRARLDGRGGIEHLLEPEYHGDPISGGVLCFYHFGWDVLDECRAAGFRNARFVMPHSRDSGLLYGLWTLVATK
ncbi:class I SAM-dependent methyltransferase [Lysobacter sp. S4-A87]|uniref:class I SAM-dependent methyltransferase n=1 Tax=Lysobacter sp. S4-A87 TaxID=2925843 RepID=UPI002738E851|nr:class I SAM-dependent methyltransferase [Lysobacter sp. S4-A87]